MGKFTQMGIWSAGRVPNPTLWRKPKSSQERDNMTAGVRLTKVLSPALASQASAQRGIRGCTAQHFSLTSHPENLRPPCWAMTRPG